MRRLVILCTLFVLVTAQCFAASPLGTRRNPIIVSKEARLETVENVSGLDALTMDSVTADITVKVEGQLPALKAFDMIYDFTLEKHKGPGLACFQVLLTAEDIKGGTSIEIFADSFKVFDQDFVEVPILTRLQSVELLDGASARMYIGVNPSGISSPYYLVFNNELWFDVLLALIIKE